MSDKNGSPNNKYKSPPPTSSKIRNPFDKVLIEKMHKPICSPGMCKIYKKRSSGSFRWEIDQACVLLPTDIVACNSQFEPSPDPALEKIAEEVNERFFSQELVIPSPLESSKKVEPLQKTSTEAVVSIKESIFVRDVSAQTVLTLPPELPPEIEKLLEPFCTYTQDQNISGDYEMKANGSLRRKLFFEEHSEADLNNYDSDHTDDEAPAEPRPTSSYEAHTPVLFSPDLGRDLVTKGMKRTFGTPLKKGTPAANKPCYRNKILNVVEFGEPCLSPIEYKTPKRTVVMSTPSSLASVSISPVAKTASSDEEKNNFTSPESEAMATCLDCISSETSSEPKSGCFFKVTPDKCLLKKSASLKESPPRGRKGSFSERRSLSMSSLHRSRSVQKLDFSMDMSVDGLNKSQDSNTSPVDDKPPAWSIVEETNIRHLVHVKDSQIRSSTIVDNVSCIDDTPIKGKCRSTILSHEISKIRAPRAPRVRSPLHMSLDSSIDGGDNPLGLEDKKIDFNNIDLKLLTGNVSQFDYTGNKPGDASSSFKRVDSGFNENTFYTNVSSYYESAIKPSELTVTNSSKVTETKTALKEISNVTWMRLDSGFKDETSDMYSNTGCSSKTEFRFSEAKFEKENMVEDYDKLFVPTSNRSETMSMSDIFTDDMTFNCNFSSTPSKNKTRKVQS